MTKLFLKLPLRPEYDGEDWRSPEHETASVTGAAPFSDADGQCVGYAVTTGWNDRDADRRDFIVKAVNAHDDLVTAVEHLARCLLPVNMTMVERDLIEEPIADNAVVLSFMGSGASDQVTAGEVRKALNLAEAALAKALGIDQALERAGGGE